MGLSRYSPTGVDCAGGVGRDGDVADGVKDGTHDGRDLARFGEEEVDVDFSCLLYTSDAADDLL